MNQEEKKQREQFKFSKITKFEQSVIKEMQNNLEYLSKVVMPSKNIQAMLRTNEIIRETMRPSIDAMVRIKPIMEENVLKQMVGVSKSLAATAVMTQAIKTQQFKEMASILNDQVRASTAGLKDLGNVLEHLREGQKSFNSFKEMAYGLEDITEKELQDFEKLDNIKTKEDIQKLEKIVEKNKSCEKPSRLLFMYIFQILLFFYVLNSSQANNLNLEINNSTNVNVQIIQSKESNDCSSSNNFLQERILELLDSLIAMAFMTGVTKVASYLKKEPSSKSDNILKLDAGERIDIIDGKKYYFKVEYYDKNGEKIEGYIAKRNIKILKEIDTD